MRYRSLSLSPTLIRNWTFERYVRSVIVNAVLRWAPPSLKRFNLAWKTFNSRFDDPVSQVLTGLNVLSQVTVGEVILWFAVQQRSKGSHVDLEFELVTQREIGKNLIKLIR
jgi:hypothetical protein